MDDRDLVKRFLDVVKKVGHYEDLYVDNIFLNEKDNSILNNRNGAEHFLSDYEVSLFVVIRRLPLEKVNRYINEIRVVDEAIELNRKRVERRIRKENNLKD